MGFYEGHKLRQNITLAASERKMSSLKFPSGIGQGVSPRTLKSSSFYTRSCIHRQRDMTSNTSIKSNRHVI